MATTQQATQLINNVTKSLGELVGLAKEYNLSELSNRLVSTSHILQDQASNIQSKAKKTMHLVNKGLNIINVVTIVTVVLNLAVVLALMVLAPLKLRRTFRVRFIVICWLVTTLLWIYFGLYFFVHRFMGDTCAALDEYRQYPNNSSLSSMLPCNHLHQARLALQQTGAGIHSVIERVNEVITHLRNPAYLGIEYICNPISGPPDYHYQACPSNTMQIGDIPQIIKSYICTYGYTERCVSVSNYNRARFYARSIQTILDVFPVIDRLVKCQVVTDAFSQVFVGHCGALKKDARMTWAALAALSTITACLVVTWIMKAHQDSAYCDSDGAVEPQLVGLTGNSDTESGDTSLQDLESRSEA